MNNPLVVCALKDEFSMKGSNYDLLYTGVGKVNAALHLTKYLLEKGRPGYIVNYGTAGSKKVNVGSLVDCTKFVQRDMDVSGLGFEKYETPFEDDISKKIDFSAFEILIPLPNQKTGLFDFLMSFSTFFISDKFK